MLKSRSSTNGRVTSPQQPEDKAFILTETQRYTHRGRHLESGKKRLEEEGRKRGGGGGEKVEEGNTKPKNACAGG